MNIEYPLFYDSDQIFNSRTGKFAVNEDIYSQNRRTSNSTSAAAAGIVKTQVRQRDFAAASLAKFAVKSLGPLTGESGWTVWSFANNDNTPKSTCFCA